MRQVLIGATCLALAACTGPKSKDTIEAPQEMSKTEPTGVSVSGYARVGVVKGG